MAFQNDTLKNAIGQAHDKWGWFVALGVLLLILGGIAFANLFVATVASVFFVGWLMLISGVMEIVVFATTSGLMFGSGWLLLRNPVRWML